MCMTLAMLEKLAADKTHLKLKITDGNYSFDAIGFNLGNYCDQLKNKQLFDCVFTIEENVWNGKNFFAIECKGYEVSF